MYYVEAESIDTPPEPEAESEITPDLTVTKMRAPYELFRGMDWREKLALKEKIWDQYADAMRLRNREPLEEERFDYHFFKGGNHGDTVIFGGEKDGFLLGNDAEGVFVPTHFAPASLRGGYRLIKGLLEEDIPTALFITQDLVDTIEKMDGYKIIPFKIKVDFHGEEVEKTLVITKWNVLPKLATGQTQKLVKSQISHVKRKLRKAKYYLEEFGEKVNSLLKGNKPNAYDLEDQIEDPEDLLGDGTMAEINSLS